MISSALRFKHEAVEQKRGGWNRHQEHGNYPDYWCFQASLTPKSLPLSISHFCPLVRSVTLHRGPSAGRERPCIIQQKTNPLDQTRPGFYSGPDPGTMERRRGLPRCWEGCDVVPATPPDTSQPALTFSLFKYYWSLLAPVRGRGCADNDVPYAALPLQLSESSMDQLRHKSSWNLILLSPIWAEHPSSKSGPVVGWDVSRL